MSAPEPAPQPEGTRLGRASRAVAAVVGGALVFSLSLAASGVAHIDTRAGRRIVARAVERGVSGAIEGRLTIGRIASLSPTRVRVEEAVLRAPGSEREVATVESLEVRLRPRDLLAIARGRGVMLEVVEIGPVKVDLAQEDGELLLARAVALRGPPGEGEGPGIVLSLPNVRLAHLRLVSASGSLDLEGLRASIESGGASGGGLSVSARAPRIVVAGPAGEELATGSFHGGAELRAGAIAARVVASADAFGASAFVSATAEGPLAGPELRVDLLSERVGALAKLLPAEAAVRLAPLADASVAAHAEGPLDDLSLVTRVAAKGKLGVELRGRVDALAQRGSVAVAIDPLDPAVLLEGAPQGELRAEGRLSFDGPRRSVTVELGVPRGALAGGPTPRVEAHVALRDREIAAGLWVEDEGLTATAGVEIRGGAATFAAEVDVDHGPGAPDPVVARFAPPGAVLRGGVAVRGSVDATRYVVDAKVAAREVALGDGQGARDLSGDVHASGAFAKPGASEVKGSLRAGDVAFGGQRGALTAKIGGTLDRPTVGATLAARGRTVEVRTQLDIPKRAVESLEVTARAGDDRLGLVARDVTIGPRGIRVGAVELDGAAKGGGSFGVEDGVPYGRFRADDVDVAALGRLVGLPVGVGGIASIDAKFDPRKGSAHGSLRVIVEDGSVSFVKGVGASLSIDLDGRKVSIGAAARLTDDEPDGPCRGRSLAVRIANASGTLAGEPLDPRAWRGFLGGADVHLDEARLECLRRRVPLAGLFVSRLDGVVKGMVRVERTRAGVSAPRVVLRTAGLGVAGPKRYGLLEPAWEYGGVDAQVVGRVTDSADLTVDLFDEFAIASLHGESAVALRELIEHGAAGARALVEKRSWTAALEIPRRALGTLGKLPTVGAALQGWSGVVGGRLEAHGGKGGPPTVKGTIAFEGVVPGAAELRDVVPPVDASVDVGFAANRLEVKGSIARASGKELARFEASTRPLDDAPVLDAKLELEKLPLASMPLLARHELDGDVRGVVIVQGLTLRGAAAEPRIAARIFADRLVVAHGPARSVVLAFDTHPLPSGGSLGVVLAQVKGERGVGARVGAAVGIDWHDGRPHFRRNAPMAGRLEAQDFDLGLLGPAAPAMVRRIAGRITGTLAASAPSVGQLDKGKLAADLRLMGGEIVLPGSVVREAGLHAVTKDDGVLEVQGISALIGPGRLTGSGRVVLEGLDPRDASFSLGILEKEAVPVSLEGAPLGSLHGVVGVRASREGDRLVVKVDLPTLGLELPAAATRDLQPLTPHPSVNVAGAAEVAERLRAAMPIVATVEIGELRVRGSGIDVRVRTETDGPIVADLSGPEPKYSGRISVLRGEVEVARKRFEVERGIVELRGSKAGNPYVNLTARHDVADGTRVYVDYVGLLRPITDEKLTLRSDPPHTKAEIFSILALGTGDTGQGTLNSTAGSKALGGALGGTAGGVGAGLASDQVNAFLRGMPGLRGLTTSFGVSDKGNFTAALVIEANDKVSARLSAEAPSQQPQGSVGGTATSRSGTAQVSLDWRLVKDLLLRASVGIGDQITSGLDLLWQYRY